VTPEQREAHSKSWHESWNETTPQKLNTLLPEQVQPYYQFFCTALTWFDEDNWRAKRCRERVAQLSLEIQKRQHGELRAIGKTTLIWVIVTAGIGIAALLTECGPLIRDTFFSKAQPANAPQATPSSLHQIRLPTNAGVEPVPSSSTSKPSPEPTATEQSSATTPTPNANPKG